MAAVKDVVYLCAGAGLHSFRQGKGQQAEQGSTPGMPTTDEEVYTAALQFVRKISGYRKPFRANEQAFSAFCS